jgi:hypothetical protein
MMAIICLYCGFKKIKGEPHAYMPLVTHTDLGGQTMMSGVVRMKIYSCRIQRSIIIRDDKLSDERRECGANKRREMVS